MQTSCHDFLGMIGMQETIDTAASSCAAPLEPCTSYPEFITTGTASMSPGLRTRSRLRTGGTSTARVGDASGRSQWVTVL